MLMWGPSMMRAMATVHNSSSSGGSGAPAISVPFFARKFCTITSCTGVPARGL